MGRVLGQSAAIAVVVFVVVVIWLSAWRSFHPTNSPNEAQQQESADTTNQHRDEGKGFFERTTEDPIAFFTLWLTLFTGVLAAFTMWMALSTKDLRDFAEEQARDMKAAIAESKRSADAAKAAAELAKQASDATAALERPFFYVGQNRGESF
jgi:fucose permease